MACRKLLADIDEAAGRQPDRAPSFCARCAVAFSVHARMRTARPVPAPPGSGSAASQPLRNARRRGEQSTRDRSITPDDLRRDASYLRSRIWRVHAHGCMHVLDDLLGESGRRRGEVKMPPRENAGPKFSAGEVSPRLEGTRMSDLVGAGKCGDRTSNAILWIDRIPRNEREICS